MTQEEYTFKHAVDQLANAVNALAQTQKDTFAQLIKALADSTTQLTEALTKLQLAIEERFPKPAPTPTPPWQT